MKFEGNLILSALNQLVGTNGSPLQGHFPQTPLCLNKKVCSYHFLVNFFQKSGLSLSLGVLKPCSILKI